MARHPRWSIIAAVMIVLSALALCGGVAGAGMNTGTSTIRETITAGPYKVRLDIGPLERMYTPAQAKKQHPTSGEIMVSGTMVMGGMGMGGPMPNHHLEVHVYDRKSSKIITKAMVQITVLDAKGKLVTKVPVAEMYGVKEGMSDFHYGNNVALKDGTPYRVVVRVNKITATFMATVGKSSSGGMSM